MQNSRESIYTALAALLKTITGMVSVSRVYRSPTDYSSAVQLPAGCIDEVTEGATVPVHGNPAVYRLDVHFWMYLPAPQVSQIPGQETLIPMTALNNMLDALDVALPNPASPDENYTTLGGLVEHVWIEGKILKTAGVGNGNTPLSIARVPILILAT